MLALDRILVLDLNRRYPGAYTAMFLGDFGAEVIKIDSPGSYFGVPGVDTTTEEFAAYYAPDRNKRSIVLNLREEKGLEAFYRLAKNADVLIEGFRPGIMKSRKGDYDTLKEINPRLIYCSLTGFGPDGPYADIPAHDMNYCAIEWHSKFHWPQGRASLFCWQLPCRHGGSRPARCHRHSPNPAS
jgi:crotonobetainyl-CoA:carnitine CoA-transferase CaiB-like acyl-CoA transferase